MKDSAYDPLDADRLLDRISPANRPVAARFLKVKRAQGLKASSLSIVARALFNADRLVQRPLAKATPDELASALSKARESMAHASVHQLIGQLKSFYKWLHDGEVPRTLRSVLVRRKTPHTEFRHVAPITEAEFRALLEACADHRPGADPAVAARKRAIIWLAWDSGFRRSELFALRVGSLAFDERGGARITIPSDAPDLKTGARTIYVVESAGALSCWLAMHPARSDPRAPLFFSVRTGGDVWANSFDRWLRPLCRKAGIRAINPHLFRHTRATRAAEAGWNEASLRAYFGWSNDSRMAAHYVHLSRAHAEELVLADANLDPIRARVQADPQKAIAEVASAAAASSSAAVVKALMDAGVIPRPVARKDDDEDTAQAPS